MSKYDAMIKGRARLTMSRPFYGTLAMRLKLTPVTKHPQVPTAATDGISLFYDVDWIKSLTDPQVEGLIAHEVMHCGLAHHVRMQGREEKRWNRACDYAINQILIDDGMQLPEGGCIDAAYKDMSAEKIYELLEDDCSEAPSWGLILPFPGRGDGDDDKQPVDAEAMAKMEESEWKQALSQGLAIAKAQGTMPKSLERLIEDTLEPEVDWREALRHLVTQLAKDDYTWKRPNRRFIADGLYLPTLHSEAMGPVVIGVDTSGSITNKELSQFSAEISAILQDCKPEKIHVVYCDSRVAGTDEYTVDDLPLQLVPKGGGGTAFKPVFDWVEAQQVDPVCLVYLTDLYGNDNFDPPDYPVYWVCTSSQVAAFGETSHIMQ